VSNCLCRCVSKPEGFFLFLWEWFCQYLKYVTSDAFSLPLSPSFPSFLPSFFFITNIVTGDQSPSSPAARWPGANYGNRTLGVLISLPLNPDPTPCCFTMLCCWLNNSHFFPVRTHKLSWSPSMQSSLLSFSSRIYLNNENHERFRNTTYV